MRLRPGSLFARVLLTLVLSFGSFALITFGSMVYYVLYPVVQRSTADLAAFMELSARTLALLPEQAQQDYQAKLLNEYQVRLLSGSQPPQNLDDFFYPYVMRLSQALSQRLDHPVRMKSNLIDGRRWFWIDLKTSAGTVWAGIPRDRIGTRPMIGAVVISALAVLLVVLTAAILARRVTAPLTRLSQAAEEVAKGRSPEPLAETGPHELANLARQFNETSQQVKELLADRTVLLAGISHDLRTPLTRLRLAIEMLPEDTDAALTARMRRDIEEMSAQIGQAVELGGTLGAGARAPEDLAKLISEVVGHRPRILWRPLGRCIHSVNAAALRRILGNLIENALRYSSGTVEVRLDCRHQTPALFVLDRGPGIPTSEREAVFRPFYRLERSRNRTTGGSGLGLAIARQLAVANEMEIELSERDAGGLIASIRLPAAHAGDDTEPVH